MKKLLLFCATACAFASTVHADIVVIANPNAPALTKDQIQDIFLGKNASYTPVDLPEAAPIRAEFYKKATDRDLAQVKTTWARMIFTGKVQPMKVLPDAAAVKKAVAADASTIGYIERSAVDSSVKVLLALE